MTIHKLDTKMYVTQKAFIRRNGKILVLRDPQHAVKGQIGLDFPGGKYRWGRTQQEELKREVDEETGLRIKIGNPFISWTNLGYKTKHKNVNLFIVGYLCEYVSGEVKLSNEHDEFEWIDEKSHKKWEEDSPYFKALEKYFEVIKSQNR